MITIVLVKEDCVWAYDIALVDGQYVMDVMIPCGARADLVAAAVRELDGHLMTTQAQGCRKRRRRR